MMDLLIYLFAILTILYVINTIIFIIQFRNIVEINKRYRVNNATLIKELDKITDFCLSVVYKKAVEDENYELANEIFTIFNKKTKSI